MAMFEMCLALNLLINVLTLIETIKHMLLCHQFFAKTTLQVCEKTEFLVLQFVKGGTNPKFLGLTYNLNTDSVIFSGRPTGSLKKKSLVYFYCTLFGLCYS